MKLQLEHPVLAACYDAAARGIAVSGDRAGQPTLRLITSPDGNTVTGNGANEPDEPVAEVCGINVYAKHVVDGENRWQVERLCRYMTRPPVAEDRLTRRSDGMLELAFRHPWKDGSRAVILSPDDLLVRLCAAVPPPRVHQVRYFGVLSSHASLRPEVVSSRGHDDGAHRPPPAWGDQLELSLAQGEGGSEHGKRHRWAWLLAHVFLADLEDCPKCQGPMRWAEVAKTPSAAARLMARMEMVPEPVPRPPHPSLEQLRLPFDS